MEENKEEKKKKKIIFFIIFIIIILILLLLCFFRKPSFYTYGENLFETLQSSNESYGELDSDYNFSDYSCSTIIYSEGLLEFYDCEVEKDKVEDYCIYDGKNFDCSKNDKILDITFSKDNNDKYSNENINITLDYDKDDIKELLYCNTTGDKCVPEKEYDGNITLDENSNTNKVCVKAIYSDGSESEIICSENYMIDKIPPTINTPIILGDMGNNGYYISDVTIKEITAEDTLSGIKETDINISVIDYDTTGEKIIIKAVDNAGNITEEEIIIKVDKTKPTPGKIILEGNIGSNGWYTSDVKIDVVNGTDNISGHDKTYVNVNSITNSTSGTEIILTTIDKAGNKSTTTQTIKVDKDAPTITGLSDINIYAGETIDFLSGITATDSVSKLSGNIVVIENDFDKDSIGTYYVTYKAVDNASNITEVKRKVIVNLSPLTVDFHSNIASSNGWYNEDIFVEFDIKETVTDINYCITSETDCVPSINYINKVDITNEGNNKICMSAKINGSESEVICSDTYKLDKQLPSVTNIKINNTDPKEWYNETAILTSYEESDSLSGVKEVIVTNREIANETNGEYITIKVIDNALNEKIETVLIKIDKTKPVISYSLSGNTENNIWYLSDVTVSNVKATDTQSGTLSVNANKTLFSDETTGENLVITAIDKAGNVAVETVSIKIDKTAPVINSYDIIGTLENGWYTTAVSIANVVASDNISGIDEEFLANVINNLNINYETKGENIEFQVKDKAGHTTTGIFNVKIDLVNPNSGEIILSGDEGTNDWYTSDVLITNTEGTDSISGVKESELNIDIVVDGSTDTTVELTTVDKAGHDTVTSENVKVDSEMPILESIEIFGTLGDNGWYTSDVKFGQVTAYDEGSGYFESKIDILDINENTPGTKVTITITDNASNTLTTSKTIKIDKNIPTITSKGVIKVEEGRSVNIMDNFEYSFGISEGSVTCTLDGTAGEIKTEELAKGTYNLVCTAKSNAGLSNSAATTIVVDDEYEILDYIESNGGQYIDTGIMNTGDYIFESEFLATNLAANSGSWLIGGRIDYDYSLGIHLTTRTVFSGYGLQTRSYTPAIAQNTWHTLYFSRFKLDISGRTYPIPGQILISEEHETDIRIGGNQVLSGGGADNRNFYGYIRSFKITDVTTNTLLRDYIPVKINATDEVGLYDLVENKFYKSIGTTEYIPHYK